MAPCPRIHKHLNFSFTFSTLLKIFVRSRRDWEKKCRIGIRQQENNLILSCFLITITHIDEEAELVEGQLLVRREDIVAQLDERVVVAPDDVAYRRPIERLNNRINISLFMQHVSNVTCLVRVLWEKIKILQVILINSIQDISKINFCK
jgi:hypothetical protein